MKLIFSFCIASLVIFSGCGSPDSNGAKHLSVTSFDSIINANPDAQLVDVRTIEEFQGSHITGALNYDWNDATFADNIKQLDETKPVLLYCRSGARSSEAAEFLAKNGFQHVYALDGGLTAWENAGGAVAKPDAANTTPNPDEVTVEAYNKTIAENDVVLVDFSATWCGPCKILAPSLHELEDEMKGKFVLLKVDVDRDANLADYMNIAAMPTLVLYKKGEIKWRNEGLVPKETVAQQINSVQ